MPDANTDAVTRMRLIGEPVQRCRGHASAEQFILRSDHHRAILGSNRYDTATQIAEAVFASRDTGRLVGSGVGLATGLTFPDALSATASLAVFAEPSLLILSSLAGGPKHRAPSSRIMPAMGLTSMSSVGRAR